MENTIKDIIADLGGASAVAAALNLNQSNVWSWGDRNSVPDAFKTKLVDLAKEKGVDLTLTHFFPELKESA